MPVHRSTMRWMATLAAATSLVLIASAGNVLAQADPTVTYGQQITDFGFDPIQLSVNAGDTVTWTNAGAIPHAVTADDGSFDSGLINPADTFDISFSTPRQLRLPLHSSPVHERGDHGWRRREQWLMSNPGRPVTILWTGTMAGRRVRCPVRK